MIPGNHDNRDGLLFSLPFLLVFVLFMVYPLGFGLYISFFKWNILGTPAFYGLGNYLDLVGDPKFWSSLWHTVEFVLITTPTLLVLGFAMALLVTGKSPIGGLMETVFDRVAIWSVCLATLWWTAGFNMVLFTAGIKQIPKEIYESAEIDGASKGRTLRCITIPLVAPTTVLCLILQVIASFNVFGQVYVMTGGGPAGSTRVLVQYIYENGFKYFKMGYSAAMSYVLFAIILLVSLVQYVALNRKED